MTTKVERGVPGSRSWRGALALGASGVLLGGCYGKSNDAGPANTVDVVSIYSQMCARCHGVDGRGDAEMKKTIPGIRDFSEPMFQAKPVEELESVIMTGRNQMPGFGGALTRPKIQHLSGYVRRLGQGIRGDVPVMAPGAGATEPVAPPAGAGAPAKPAGDGAGGPGK